MYRNVILGRNGLQQANYVQNNFIFQSVALGDIISVVRCNCKETKKGCCTSAKGLWRNNDLKCVSTYGYCRGDGCDKSSLCSNGKESDDDDVQDNIFEIMLGY